MLVHHGKLVLIDRWEVRDIWVALAKYGLTKISSTCVGISLSGGIWGALADLPMSERRLLPGKGSLKIPFTWVVSNLTLIRIWCLYPRLRFMRLLAGALEDRSEVRTTWELTILGFYPNANKRLYVIDYQHLNCEREKYGFRKQMVGLKCYGAIRSTRWSDCKRSWRNLKDVGDAGA